MHATGNSGSTGSGGGGAGTSGTSGIGYVQVSYTRLGDHEHRSDRSCRARWIARRLAFMAAGSNGCAE